MNDINKCFFRLKVERRFEYYLKRVCIVIASLSAASLLSFGVPSEQVAERLSQNFTLLLTIVAFQFIVSTSLPVVPFLTFLDKYIMGGFLFVILVSIPNAIVNSLSNDQTIVDDIDRIFLFVFMGNQKYSVTLFFFSPIFFVDFFCFVVLACFSNFYNFFLNYNIKVVL